MENSEKTKVSTDFNFTKLITLGFVVLFGFRFLEARKTDDLYTELWFLCILVSLFLLIRLFMRPKVYSDKSSFYFKKFNKPEIQVSFKDIKIIEENPISVKGNVTYRIQYLDKERKQNEILFYTDSYKQMKGLIGLVKEANHLAKIV